MPHYVALGRDSKDAKEIRRNTRPAHLAYLESLGSAVRVAGPILSEGNPVGSIIIIEADDRKAAESIFGNDPYIKSGLFAEVEIVEWKPVVGTVGS